MTRKTRRTYGRHVALDLTDGTRIRGDVTEVNDKGLKVRLENGDQITLTHGLHVRGKARYRKPEQVQLW